MGRHRADHLKYAHYELESWASWVHTHQGENGVMGSQVMSWSGVVPDTPPHALVPRVDMPRQISLVDMAYNDAPENHRISIKIKYLDMGRLSRNAEDKMLEYVSGVLAGGRYEGGRKAEAGEFRKCEINKIKKIF